MDRTSRQGVIPYGSTIRPLLRLLLEGYKKMVMKGTITVTEPIETATCESELIECAFCRRSIPRPSPHQAHGRVFCDLRCFGRFWTKLDRNSDILAMRNKGVPVAEIARRFSISPGRVRAIITAMDGVATCRDSREFARESASVEQTAEIMRLHRALGRANPPAFSWAPSETEISGAVWGTLSEHSEWHENCSVVMGHDLPPLHSHDILRCVRHIPL